MRYIASILFISCFLLAGNRANGQGAILLSGFGNSTVDIDTNYWGGLTPPVIAPPSATNWPNFNFTAPHGAISFTPLPDLSCSSDQDDVVKKGFKKSLSVLSNDTDSCAHAIDAAYNWEVDGINLGLRYDTMKWYISHCYKNASDETWSIFGQSLDSITQTQAGRDSVYNFVLYALGFEAITIGFAPQSILEVKFDGGYNGQTPNYRDNRAIFLYLMNNPRCAFNYINDSAEYGNLLATQWNLWADSSAPGSTFDSSVPTLHDLGLDTLLAINAKDGVTFALPTPSIINSASITENPFDNSTSIALSIGREAYITIAVYNVLGQQIAGAGYAGVFEQGSATVGINMSSAPPGAYLVRISTANNEVQTLKLTKE